ncbi:MAG TPA: DUF2630 family protein [Casimicrobiaceae bacterium]|nr:DUF2630 family protein [Casimicrobiaceae bacterium]
MQDQAKDAPVLTHIQQLVAEEHHLFDKGSLDASESRRLSTIQVELDQCWDLLRQRRALRETGGDVSAAHVRPPEVVEKYTG